MQLPYTFDEPIRTPRLVLRPFRAGDVDSLLMIHSDPDAVRYVPYPPRDRDAVAEVLTRKVGSTTLAKDGDLLELAVDRADTDGLIGDLLISLQSVEHQTVELGYIFATAQTGQGYATEAVRALLGIAFGPVRARRAVARVDSRNDRSLALLDRIGLRREAELVENEWFKGELTSEVDYAILLREWPTAMCA